MARWNWLTGGLSRTCQIIWDIFFEDICSQYLWALLLKGKSPVDFSELGRWWGTDPRTRSQTEIDIMAEQDRQAALFGECKWTNEKSRCWCVGYAC